MRPSAFAGVDRVAFSNRETPARRIGVILSIVFLASVGAVASLTGTPAGAHAQADAGIDPTMLSSAATR